MLDAKLESLNDFYAVLGFAGDCVMSLEKVAARLHKELGTNYFSLCRLRDKNLFGTCITTNIQFGEYWFVAGNLFPVPPSSGFYLADRLPMFYRKELIQYIKEYYGIDNLLFYVDHRKKYIDLYSFASALNRPDIVYKYLNGGTNIIMKFIPYFRENFKNLLDEGDQQHIIYIQNDAAYTNPYFPNEDPYEKNSIKYSSTQIKQFESDLKHLPDRIYDAVQLSALGMTAKESAKELNIAYRTVEGYIASAKNKLNVSNIQQLRDLFLITTT